MAVFLGTVEKFFTQRWLSPRGKIGPHTPMKIKDKHWPGFEYSSLECSVVDAVVIFVFFF